MTVFVLMELVLWKCTVHYTECIKTTSKHGRNIECALTANSINSDFKWKQMVKQTVGVVETIH